MPMPNRVILMNILCHLEIQSFIDIASIFQSSSWEDLEKKFDMQQV